MCLIINLSDWRFVRRGEFEEFKKTMITRQQLDDAIAGLAPAISTSVSTAVKQAVQPFVDKATANPDIDYTPEVANLTGLPATVGKAVSDAIADAFAPLTATPAQMPDTTGSSTGSNAEASATGS